MKKILIIAIITLLGVLFIRFGRTIYMPIIIKLRGKESIESRVAKIQNKVWERIEYDLGIAGYKMDFPKKIILVAFKEERILQVYSNDFYGIKLLKTYPFTAYSGKLGPKLEDGDKQIPEGIYKVQYLNPNSSYYLSIKINYPNEFDKSKSKLSNIADMGKDIFIHGKSATIGCIPIGDEAIEEVFVLTQKAINYKVDVIISPRDFRTNPNFPNIENIEWENELYALISEKLCQLKN
ncbi:MAG: L,D-transpeptidase family protein [Saprospiraceae bacterium]